MRAEVAALASAALPPDLASSATTLDAKLATFGGATGRGGRGGGGGGGGRGGRGGGAPGSIASFTALNGSFNQIVALMQDGLDMAPTKSQIDTWEADCKEYTATVAAWRTMLGVDLVSFNDQMTKAGKSPVKVTPTALTAPASCGFVAPPPVASGRGGH